MLQAIIHRLLQRRHFWRYATFSEVAELYASRLLTMFALRFVLVFSSVYLYKQGYSLEFIALFWAVYFFLKAVFAWPSAKIAAYFGPKHGLLYANIIFAFALLSLSLSTTLGIYALFVWCALQAFGGSLNNLCYHIDFSKVKHSEHAGKELGYMAIIEKIAAGVSPLLGGIVASVFGPLSAMILSTILFLLSAVPLLRTSEPTRLHQKLEFNGYPWRQTWRGLLANSGIGADVFASNYAWIIFITVIVFAGDGNELYAKIGLLTSLGLVVALTASYVFGRLIDNRQGLLLLRSSVVVNSLVHLLRPTVGSAIGVVVTNTTNEITTTGITMSFTRGLFDSADLSGKRIVYLYLVEVTANIGGALAALCLFIAFAMMDTTSSLNWFFIGIAAFSLVIATPRFILYRR